MCVLEKQKSELNDKIKKTYIARYKCRNCGRLYENRNVTLNNWIMPEAPMYHPHFCDNNIYAIGDLILVRNTDDVSDGWESDFGNIELEDCKKIGE